MKRITFFLLVALATGSLLAQDEQAVAVNANEMSTNTQRANRSGYWSIASELGLNVWNGDFHPSNSQFFNGFLTSPNAGLMLEYNISPILATGFALGGIILNQEDANEKLYLRGMYVYPYLSTDFLGLFDQTRERNWSIWGSIGMGLYHPIRSRYSLTTFSQPDNVPTTTLTNIETPPAVMLMPVKLSLERSISPTLSLGLGYKFNILNSDAIDGLVSGNYNDHYHTLTLGVRYRIQPRSTGRRTSPVTGWKYDFTAPNAFRGSVSASFTPPGMVLIPGGSFTVDDTEEYETATFRARPNELNTRKTLSVNSFYMDKHEIRNVDWREYIAWLTTVYGKVAPERIDAARPDMNAWREGMTENEPFMMDYFSNPVYDQYPVVCVSWEQAAAYCKWRTDRVNELLLVKAGVIPAPDYAAIGTLTTLEEVENAVFSSERFFSNKNQHLASNYKGTFVSFRLPSEIEWEYAAYARKSTDPENKVYVYPWSARPTEKLTPRMRDQMQAHYNNSNATGSHVDVFSRTVPVNHFSPNDFGLYNMAGNVSEWVHDSYTSRGNIQRIEREDILDEAFLPDYHRIPDARVYKGGSWKDVRYWLHPSTRRYLDPRSSANNIGFRCAMTVISL
jgi:formylglycine-generating enzyme required for sulfatase activity